MDLKHQEVLEGLKDQLAQVHQGDLGILENQGSQDDQMYRRGQEGRGDQVAQDSRGVLLLLLLQP